MGRRGALALEPIVSGVDQPAADQDEVATQVLDAAAELMGELGLGRWSIDDVAARAGLGRTTVYRRFDGRDALVQAVMVREVRRFVAAVSAAVAHVDDLAEQVTEGMLVGLRIARASVLPALVRLDGASVLPALTTGIGPALDAARSALVEQYRLVRPAGGPDPDDPGVALVAESLVRLALSWLLAPSSLVDLDDDEAARAAISRLVRALLPT
jgi:AcrR family transcriptional regulator